MTHLILLAEATSQGPVGQVADTFGVSWKLLIAQIISFAIVCLCLYKFAYKRVLTILEERRQKIAEGLAAARKTKRPVQLLIANTSDEGEKLARALQPAKSGLRVINLSPDKDAVFREAFRIAQDGRPGAVLIDLPVDVQRGMIEYDPTLTSSLPRTKPAPTPTAIDRALDMLKTAERPLLMLGGGVMSANACEEFRALAEYLNIPVTITLMGKGGFPEDHPLYAGMAGIQTQTRYGNQIFLESDLVVAIGARFADRHTGDLKVYRGERKFIQIDIEPTQIGRVFTPDWGPRSWGWEPDRALPAGGPIRGGCC